MFKSRYSNIFRTAGRLETCFAIGTHCGCSQKAHPYTQWMSLFLDIDAELSTELEDVLDSCVTTLLRHGYEDTTMSQLVEASGTSHDFVAQHFSTKKQFCSAALRWYFYKFYRQLRAVLALHNDAYSAVEAVLFEFISLNMEQYKAHKSLWFHSLLDIADLDPELHTEVTQLKKEGIQHFISKMQALSKEFKTPDASMQLAGFYVMIFEGLAVMVRNGMPEEDLYRNATLSLEVLRAQLK